MAPGCDERKIHQTESVDARNSNRIPAEVAVVSPVEGDSSPPPSVALYTPDQALGTIIEITDLDDLADETISTLNLILVRGRKRLHVSISTQLLNSRVAAPSVVITRWMANSSWRIHRLTDK